MADVAATEVGLEQVPVFQSNLPIGEKLERARLELLDFSARNRLLSMARSSKSARSVGVVDERSAEVFRLLVREGRTLTFLAAKKSAADAVADVPLGETDEADESEEVVELAQPEDDVQDERGVYSRHADTRLQTRLTTVGLQKRLLDMYLDARTLEEEQGVNILYLALGTLKWVDPAKADQPRHAPLLLIPVSLARGNAGEKFKLKIRPEDFASNLTLEAFLERNHGIQLPAFEAADTFDPATYMVEVADATSAKTGWSVQPDDITLGFFSFAKFLMYRDLDPKGWPENAKIADQSLVRALLADGFDGAEPLLHEEAPVDEHVSPAEMLHILDSDSSQTLAIHEVRRGRNIVIQGPPGTGKSQTIANIVASAVADGKTVLFIAEKMAALEVVKRRLDASGVGECCLELHSHKANKRAVLDELRRTWELGPPRGPEPGSLNQRLEELRDRLNDHVRAIHAMHPVASLTPYEVIGQLVRLRRQGERPSDIRLEAAPRWTQDDFAGRREVLLELGERVRSIGRPADHAWCGVGLPVVTPMEVDRLLRRLAPLGEQLKMLERQQIELAERLGLAQGTTFNDIGRLAALARRVFSAPAADALASTSWDERRTDLLDLLDAGERHAALVKTLKDSVTPTAWRAAVNSDRSTLGELPGDLTLETLTAIGMLAGNLPQLTKQAETLANLLGCATPTTLADVRQLLRIAERVGAAPAADPAALTADLWNHATDRAAALVQALVVLASSRSAVGERLSATAWTTDLAPVRATLAAHGTNWMRYFSGEWRRANRQVRALSSRPDQSFPETIDLLDALARGQAAARTIEQDDDLGRVAFGTSWSGKESPPEQLQALVEWMRSIKDLGPHVRMAAAVQVDRPSVIARAARLEALLGETMTVCGRLESALASPEIVLGPADRIELVNLVDAGSRAARYQAADRATVSVLSVPPATLAGRQDVLERLISAQRLAADLEAAQALGTSAFSALWRGPASDWSSLQRMAQWVEANEPIRAIAAAVVNRSGLEDSAAELDRQRLASTADFLAFREELRIEPLIGDIGSCALAEVIAQTDRWLASGEQLSAWTAYRDRADRGRALGCGELVDRLHDGRIEPDALLGSFEMSYYESLYEDQVRAEPAVGRFDGMLHNRLVRDFAELDQQRITASRVEVTRAHHRRMPPRQGGTVGPLGVLRMETQKKKGHLPIRRLMEKSGPAVQALKPVFMMSPLSVAQFLPRGALEFDLLVMDEASQIQPVDAIGAVARARQVVVVGDPKQLPPTAFFAKMTGNVDDSDEDDGSRVADIESILGLFAARGLPTRMLRWHYRSRHQSLIAVSNRQFYEDKLLIVPSPYTSEAGMGLRFHHVTTGIFDAGNTRTNVVEAEVVARAVIEHARRHPDLSLGVAAFSAAQRRTIVEQLELLRRESPPDVEAFFQAHPTEPFFIKNLENVQGDERDVIFISVGYGPTVLGGAVPKRFGPLGTEGGERRLNVLISRAKQRCEVYASMTDEDIDLDFARTRKGVFAFRLFLHYARTGSLEAGDSTGRDQDDVFEEQVADALQARGYQIHRRVGIAGIFIDLAVAHADRPGSYLLGIECDGRSYKTGRSARDRDRLRQSVLESHGWALHRIWSADWFHRPEEQLQRVIDRIEAATAEIRADSRMASSRAVPVEIVSVEREDSTEIGLVRPQDGQATAAYREAGLRRPPHASEEIHLNPVGSLASMVEDVVRIEGPVHIEEVIDRIRAAWGQKRTGARIRQAIDAAIEMTVRTGKLDSADEFLSVPHAPIQIRDRSSTLSPGLRRPEMLPPAEIKAAALETVRMHYGATGGQIVYEVARQMGFRTVGPGLRGVIEACIRQLVSEAALIDHAGILSLSATESA